MLDGRKTLIGLGTALVPYLDQLQYVLLNNPTVLPPHWALIIQGIGWALALYGRAVAKEPLIKENNVPYE